MICFLGSTHAAHHLKAAAKKKKLHVTDDMDEAHVIFISEDTPTNPDGKRDVRPIRRLVAKAATVGTQLVLTSQVPPGFTRSLGLPNIFHQAETLRIIDAEDRAIRPEYIAVGGSAVIEKHYEAYLNAFNCPILRMTWEEAEMSKIAVNTFLAAQVDTTNRLAKVCETVGAKWENVAWALKHDSRIGADCYLVPGRWEDSPHLMRDAVTLKEIECTFKAISEHQPK